MATELKALTEAQIIKAITESTQLAKKDVVSVFESLQELVQNQMKKKGAGKVKIPKLGIIIRRIKKPATKARDGINPRTGEKVKIPAKPARQVIKASSLKALKEMLEA